MSLPTSVSGAMGVVTLFSGVVFRRLDSAPAKPGNAAPAGVGKRAA